MSLRIAESTWKTLRFPRVSGDEPATAMGFVLSSQFSPREWG